MSTARGRALGVVGLLVASLLVAAQLRGRWHSDLLAVVAPSGRLFAIGQHRGRIVLSTTDDPMLMPGGVRTAFISKRPVVIDSLFPRLRAYRGKVARFTKGETPAARWDRTPAVSLKYAAFPAWALIAVALLPPARRAAILLREARRRRRGCCPACGYDLRCARGRCPECGRAAADAAASTDPPPHIDSAPL